MKSLIKISSLAFVLFMANSVFANNRNPEFTIKNSRDKTLFFEAKKMTSEDFEIRIQDVKGAILFSEYGVNPATFERSYNLSELPNGEYFLFFEDDSKTQKLPLFIEDDELKIDLENLEIIKKGIVGVRGFYLNQIYIKPGFLTINILA